EIARRLGYVPQSMPAEADISVLDAVLMGRRPHASWRASETDRKTAVHALKLMDLEGLAERSFRHLSGGERQRVLLARALAQEARILLLDEPTASLDIRHQIEVMRTVRWLADSSAVSIVIVAHDLNLAARFSDRMILMQDGHVRAAGTAGQVLTPEAISDVYGVTVKVRFEDGHPFVLVTDVVRAEAA
ncbi:MAG: ABC transporter ATP-binding protein, partial [Rhodospirillales bacterium]|nr:ABC transporter ATP-binding protein [Rhodospirillales bacterium]